MLSTTKVVLQFGQPGLKAKMFPPVSTVSLWRGGVKSFKGQLNWNSVLNSKSLVVQDTVDSMC